MFPRPVGCRRGATAGPWHRPQWTTPVDSHTLAPVQADRARQHEQARSVLRQARAASAEEAVSSLPPEVHAARRPLEPDMSPVPENRENRLMRPGPPRNPMQETAAPRKTSRPNVFSPTDYSGVVATDLRTSSDCRVSVRHSRQTRVCRGRISNSRYAESASQRSVRHLQAARYASRSPVRRNSSRGTLRRFSCGRCSRPADTPSPHREAFPSGRRSRATIRRPLKCSLTAFSERPHLTASALMYRFTIAKRRFSRGRAFHSETASSASRSSVSVQRCHIRGAAPCWFTHDRNVLSTTQIVARTPPIAAMATINLVVSLIAGLRLQSQFAV